LIRFIPACAGNSEHWLTEVALLKVHPRVCGEQVPASDARSPSFGSSPRVRGTVNTPEPLYVPERFIPACAGNRRRSACNRSNRAVHPRVCGEQGISYHVRYHHTGSSPRVRGTDGASNSITGWIRFIPACAGNS